MDHVAVDCMLNAGVPARHGAISPSFGLSFSREGGEPYGGAAKAMGMMMAARPRARMGDARVGETSPPAPLPRGAGSQAAGPVAKGGR
jgi:hypothetical protein